MIRFLIASLLLFLLIACGSPGQSPQPRDTLYREDFLYRPLGWSSWYAKPPNPCCSISVEPVAVIDGVAVSLAGQFKPWGVDRNHGDPGGLGDLAMVFHVCLAENNYGCVSEAPAMDLRGTSLRVRLRHALRGPSQTRLVWWFQTLDSVSGKYVNMAAIGTPLDTDHSGAWHEITITPRTDDWVCIGSIDTRADFYGCTATDAALEHAGVGTGLILFPLDRADVTQGQIEIDWIEIYR